MAASAWRRRSLVRRHSEGTRGAMPGSRGGRVQELLGHVFDEQGEQQVGIEPTSRQLGLLGRQAVDVQQALEPFGEQFDLPAQPVDGDDQRGWIVRAIQRGG